MRLPARYATFSAVLQFPGPSAAPSVMTSGPNAGGSRWAWMVRAGACLMAVGLICTLLVVPPLHGQRSTRTRVSPHETANSVVDGATIGITYGRPSMRARKIFGSLVPYEGVWMPGADEATIFQTSAPLQFDDFRLPAWSYSLYTISSEKWWTLIVNKMTGQFHTY